MKYDEQMVESLVYWVNEREKVRINKEAGLPRHKWTDDPILRTYHFCNVRREDDRGTKEIRKLIRTVEELDRLPAFYTMARMFNKASTVQTWLALGLPGVKERRDAGEPVFHVAYVVSTCGESMDKIDYVARTVFNVAKIDVPRTSCRDAFEALRSVPGLGSFLASQVVADLKNDRYLADAPDFDTFSTMGPGSKKMLDHIFYGGTTERNYEQRISSLATIVSGKIPALHRQDLQNVCCEAGKFIRYRDDLPGRRRTY